MSRRKPQIDAGFEETQLLILSLAPNQRVKAKRDALGWLPVGRKYACHRAVLSTILERFNWKDAGCYPSIRRICADTGYSRTHVKRCLTYLRSSGYVLRMQRISDWGDQISSVYTVAALVGRPAGLPHLMDPPRAAHGPTQGHPRPHGVGPPTAHRTSEGSTIVSSTLVANQTSRRPAVDRTAFEKRQRTSASAMHRTLPRVTP